MWQDARARRGLILLLGRHYSIRTPKIPINPNPIWWPH
jgi:hypothetical protein